MKNSKEKKAIIIQALFEKFSNRWKNIKQLCVLFPKEGLVLAYCFTEALGYYRFEQLSSSEQFIKILNDYQSNSHYLRIPGPFIEKLPMTRSERLLGKNIGEDILKWLKASYPKHKDLHLNTVWKHLPRNIRNELTKKTLNSLGYVYEITWAGYYWQITRNAGIHRAKFPETDFEDELEMIITANNEILNRLKRECLDETKFPFQLRQPKSLDDIVY